MKAEIETRRTDIARPSLSFERKSGLARNKADRGADCGRVGKPEATLPPISQPLLSLFSAYAKFYVARHFHAVRVAQGDRLPLSPSHPLIVYSNHASWWDPLVGLLLKERCFRERTGYAPIDAAALQQYPFFARLGFFGVHQDSTRGAAQFLRTCERVVQQTNVMIWMTPQGRFADARERPVRFRSGLGHLASRVAEATFLPIALEYTFWEEKTPEVLVELGKPVRKEKSWDNQPASQWSQILENSLAAAQTTLAAKSMRRQSDRFDIILRGRSGVGGIYDLCRRWRALWRGEHFQKGHGRL